MWQSFLDNTSLVIGGKRIKAYFIMHTILRMNLDPPSNLTQFILESGMPQ